MKIWHRISLDREDEEVLIRLGIEYKKSYDPSGDYGLVFSIHEDDPRWPEISHLAEERQTFNFPYTSFTDEEILAAEWVRLCTGFKRYYPQPKRGMKWKSQTFSHTCESCGLDFDQKAPFRIKKEPQMGKYDFVSPYWTYAIFCTQRVVERLESEGLRGYEVWPVMLHREDTPSQIVSQIVFPHVAGPGLDERDKQDPEPCAECGVTKYAFHRRGYMRVKRSALRNDLDAQLTHEWFGSDTKWGFREILISNRFARLIVEEGWKGLILNTLQLV